MSLLENQTLVSLHEGLVQKKFTSQELTSATFEKIQAIIVDQLGKEEEEVQLTTRLKDELDADSLDLFQIINDIEDEFDVKIDTEEGLETVQDLVNYVDKQLAEK